MRKEYRKTALALTLVLGLGLGGCQSGGGTENGGGENGGDAFQSQTGEGEAAVGFGAESAAAQAALAYEFDSADESQGKVSDYEITAEIRLEDGAAVIEGSGAVQEGGGVTITAPGTYLLSGTLKDGQIVVDAADDDEVTLLLNGVSLTCETNAPIFVRNASRVWLTLAEDTENYVSDGAEYVLEEGEDEPDAAIFSKEDLVINGSGGLTVTGLYGHGIRSKDELVITGGNIAVTAAKEGIKGKDSLAISGGNLLVTSGEDGLQANNDTDEGKGFIVIAGGSFVIEAGNDGIQAETALALRDGEFAIACGNGYNGAVDGEISAKGLKAGGYLQIDGGSYSLNTADDAAHCNGAIVINGGDLTVYTGDDGVHADETLTVNGGRILINQSAEGLEAALVTINDGEIWVTASDDGINSAGGSDSAKAGAPVGGGFAGGPGDRTGAAPEAAPGGENPSGQSGPGGSDTPAGAVPALSGQADGGEPGDSAPGGRGGFGGGRPGQDSFSQRNAAQDIVINGGYIVVDTYGDGLDANGGITMNGGTVIVNGPTSGGDGALDAEEDFEMNGGTLIAAGSAAMARGTGSGGARPGLSVTFDRVQEAGTLFHLEDEEGREILTFAPAKSWQNIVVSLPEMAEGQTVKIYLGGSHSGTAKDGVYSGGTYSGGTESYSALLEAGCVSVGQSGGFGGGPGGSGAGQSAGQDGQRGNQAGEAVKR